MLAISPVAGGAGLRIEGEADLFHTEQLRAALAALPAGDGDEVILDLAGLRFIDLAGARTLMALTQRSPGLRLVLYDPPVSLRSLIELLWPDARVELRSSRRPDGKARLGALPDPDGQGPAAAGPSPSP